MSRRSPWHYESDGDANNRTHYVARDNSSFLCGVERIDFNSKAEALKFLKDHGAGIQNANIKKSS